MKTRKQIRLIGVLAVLLFLPIMPIKAQLSHVKGVHAVGLRAGTGVGKTFDVGLTHNYYWGKHWSVSTHIDVESGKFEKSKYTGINLAPGVEASVWHPCTWFYLHLNGHLNVGYDWWNNSDANLRSSGPQIGCDLGFNMEFYAIPSLSFNLSAQEGFNYGFYSTGNFYYFKPIFAIGVRYNIL